MSLPSSKLVLVFSVVLLFATAMFYYPKWKLERTEATIAWDVSGYYWYLPAFFIYHDAKQQEFSTDILETYHPTPELQQAFLHPTGNYVMRYSAGMALQYAPFFAIAHNIASNSSRFAADGFSRPYQSAIHFGSVLIAIIGLLVLHGVLRKYFEDKVVALVLLCIVFASNYLDYTAINGAMAHNYLFLWYAVLLRLTVDYHDSPGWKRSMAIGLVVGVMALTRPTEIMALLIPLLWGVDSGAKATERVFLLRKHAGHVAICVLGLLLVGAVQPLYWYWVAGDPLIYSYQEHGFNFLKPKFYKGLLSYRSGWLTYSPIWILGLFGFRQLWKHHRGFFAPSALFTLAFMYLAWSWTEWWYGGALGQRAMIQAYPVLAFPLAAFWSDVLGRNITWRRGLYAFLALAIYYNLYWTHQAHRGGLLKAGQMTRAYFWNTLGRYDLPDVGRFRLDNPEWHNGLTPDGVLLYKTNMEDKDVADCGLRAIEGQGSLCINSTWPGDTIDIPIARGRHHWIRASATVRNDHKEWNVWSSTQISLRLLDDAHHVKQNDIRVARVLEHQSTREVWIDIKLPRRPDYDKVQLIFSHHGSSQSILIDNVVVLGL